jgi:hypothetical protein
MRNIVYLGHDNEIVLRFTFSGEFAEGGLGNFDEIKMAVGGEEYSTTGTPANLFVNGNDLVCSIGDSTDLEEGYHHVLVKGFSGVYDDGYVLLSTKLQGFPRVQVVDVG